MNEEKIIEKGLVGQSYLTEENCSVDQKEIRTIFLLIQLSIRLNNRSNNLIRPDT